MGDTITEDPTRDLGDFLAALQLGDSALPIGRFPHSYGLDPWLTERSPPAPEELQDFVISTICGVVAPLDGVIISHAHRAASIDTLVELDAAVSIRKLTRSAFDASRLPGRALSALAANLTDDDLVQSFTALVAAGDAEGHLAVVHGTLARALGIAARESVAIDLQSSAVGMLSAAVRMGAVTPHRAQVMLRAIAPTIAAAALTAASAPLSEIHSSGPELDILHMRHQRRHGRHFTT